MNYGQKIKEIIEVNIETFHLKLKYDNNKIYEVDLSSLFIKPQGLAAEILRGQMFDKCFIDSGALAWPNGLELCADSLLIKHSTQNRKKVA